MSMAVLAAIAVGCGGSGSGTESPAYSLSITRLKALNQGLVLYVGDYDDTLPPGPGWMDAIGPYATDPAIYRSPAVQETGYGYALNSAVAGANLNSFASRDTTVSIFDSTDLSRSAVAPLSTMPSPARYGTHNTIAYLDGHVADDPASNPSDQFELSRQHLKQCALGITLYTSDWDDHYPLANTWVDSIVPYHVAEASLHSPAIVKDNPTGFGYAFNIDLVGASVSALENPATTTTLFDSTVLTRNATAPTTTLPNPARYNGKNTIAHADGSVP